MAKKKTGCHKGIVRFKTARGKTIEFKGKQGPACGPRPKPKTGHLTMFKKDMAKAARSCKGKSRKAFLSCVSNKLPHRIPHRGR